MSLKRNLRSLGFDVSPENCLAGEELTALYLKQRRSVLEKAQHSSFSRLEENESKPEAYVVENNDKLTIQCRFCGNQMAIATLPPPFQLLPSEGREAKSVESRDAAVQVNLPTTSMLRLKTSDRGRNSADASAGRPPAFLMDQSPSSHSSLSPPGWNTPAGTSAETPAGTGVSQWRTSSLNESVTKKQQEAKLLPASPVRPTTPIFISSSSSSASSSPSSSPRPHGSWLNSNSGATSSTFLPVTFPPTRHTTPPRPKNALPRSKSTPPQPKTGLQSPGPPTLESGTSLDLRAPSSHLCSSPPNRRICSLGLEEVGDLAPPPGLIAPLSPRLAEEEDNEEESRGNEAVAGVTAGLPFECSVCHKDMKTKQRLRIHFRSHTGERPYRCELCSCAYAQLGSLHNHTRRKHLLLIPKPSSCRRLRQSSKKVAMAVGGAASPPTAADVNASVGFEEASKALTDSKQASDAPADSKLAGHDNIDISASWVREAYGANVAKASVALKEAGDAPADSKQASYENLDIDSAASIEGTNMATIANGVVGHDPSSFPTDLACSRDFSAEDVHDTIELNVVMNVKPITEVSPITEVNDVTEVNGVKEVNPITEVNDVTEEGLEEVVDLAPPPGLIAPLSPQLAEDNEEESRGNEAIAGVTAGLPFECSVCHKDMKTKQQLRIHLRIHTGERPYRCELCSCAYNEVGKLYSHMMHKHPLPIPKPSSCRRLRQSSKKVAMAVGGAASPPTAADVNASVGFEEASKALTDSKQASNAPADSKLAGHDNIDVRASWDRGANTAKTSVGFKEASDAPADSKQAGCDSTDIYSTASIGEANVFNIGNASAVGFKEASKAPTDFMKAGYDNIGIGSTASVRETNVANIANDVVGHDPSSFPTDLAWSRDVSAEDVQDAMELNVVMEVNPIMEVSDVEEVNDIMEVNPITEVSDLKEELNDVTELNDVKEVKEAVSDVMELNDREDTNAMVGSAISVLTRRSLRNHLEQRKDFFCLECLECFLMEEDLMKHEYEKHPHGNQQEGNDNDSRKPEPFVHLLKWTSEENLLALSPDSKPLSSTEVQTVLMHKQGQSRKASSPGLAEIPAKRAAVKRKVEWQKKVPKSNADYEPSGETDAPTPAFGEIQLQSRPRKVPEHVENYWTRVRKKSRASLSPKLHQVTLQNSTDTPAGQTDTPAGQTDTPAGQTDTPAGQTETPSRQTEIPAKQTDTPAKQTETPAGQTDTPAKQTDTPAGQTDTPAKQTDTPAKQTDTPAKQTETPSRQTETPAKQTETPSRQTETPSRQTGTRVSKAVVLQLVNDAETSEQYPVGVEASREERHAGPERQETGSTSEAPERVNALDGNIPSFLKPCSVRLLRLPESTLEAHCILGLQGTAF